MELQQASDLFRSTFDLTRDQRFDDLLRALDQVPYMSASRAPRALDALPASPTA